MIYLLLVPARGVEPLSRAYESLVLTVELRWRNSMLTSYQKDYCVASCGERVVLYPQFLFVMWRVTL